MSTRFERLTTKEFELLEDSFVQFLVVQGIDASSWVKLKEENPEKMNQLLDQFSEYVHLSTLVSCRFISKFSENILITSQISKDKISTFQLTLTESDLEKIDSEESLLEALSNQTVDCSQLSFEATIIDRNREDHIYKLLKTSGYKIDKGRLYKMLAMIQADKA